MSEWCEETNKQANKRMDKKVVQHFHLNSWLLWTLVLLKLHIQPAFSHYLLLLLLLSWLSLIIHSHSLVYVSMRQFFFVCRSVCWRHTHVGNYQELIF